MKLQAIAAKTGEHAAKVLVPDNDPFANDRVIVLTKAAVDALIDAAVDRALDKRGEGPNEVMNLKQTAEFLDRHTKVVTQLVREEGLPAHGISPRELRFLRSELIAWIKERAVPKTTETENTNEGE